MVLFTVLLVPLEQALANSGEEKLSKKPGSGWTAIHLDRLGLVDKEHYIGGQYECYLYESVQLCKYYNLMV